MGRSPASSHLLRLGFPRKHISRRSLNYAAFLAACSSSSWMNVWYGFFCLAASARRRCNRNGSILIAINWRVGLPVFGRPTLRARRSSSSVDCGISEKSIWLSGIGLAFFPARVPRADDPDCLFVIFQPPYCVNHN
jgi:hypothetical protein